MTLVLAIACSDGVVIAADSASSDPDCGSKQMFKKVKRIGNLPILYGGSGDVGLLQNIDDALSAFNPKQNLKRIRQEIKKLVVPELKDAQSSHVPYPQMPFHQPPIAILLFAGVQDGKPWILEIERDGRDTTYGEDMGNFAAIGSAKTWAQAIFRPHLRTPRDLTLGKIFAYRVVKDSIDLAAAYVAEPIQISTISLDGNVTEIDSEEISGLSTTCELWRKLEQDAVGELLAGRDRQPKEPEIPRA